MPIETILITTLGPAIAKSMLRIWLRNSPITLDTSLDLVDIVSNFSNDALTQRKSARQLEAIGDEIAYNVLQLFRVEGAEIDESAQESIIHEIAYTLNNAKLDASLLIENNLDPKLLTQALLNINPTATRDFSATESALYVRTVGEISEYLVDIASKLPHFTERSIAEILSTEGELLAIVRQILDEVRHIRESSQLENPELSSAEFETQYHRAIIRALDKMELFGAGPIIRGSSRIHPLSTAYITLSVEQTQASTESESLILEYRDPTNAIEPEILPIDTIMAQNQQGPLRLLLRGPAGSGKTTLLKWIAVKIASRSFDADLEIWNERVPFFIQLRRFTIDELPTPEQFPSLTTPIIAGEMPPQWVHQQLRRGRAAVLVDGLDEISARKRESARKWLIQLLDAYPDIQCIVTSRSTAINEGWLASQTFKDAELQPMSLSDIDAFIDHWHDAVSQDLNETDRIDALALAPKLKRTVRQLRALRSLATNPLLCAMICALHRERVELPSHRLQLYDDCIQMLVERREIERGINVDDYPQLTYDQKRYLLERLAYHLSRNDLAEIEIGRAQAAINRYLSNMINTNSPLYAHEVLRLFVDRTGMLRRPTQDTVDFAHRTFQEFLAAKQAIDSDDSPFLITNAHDDRWRETIIMAAGHASRVSAKLNSELVRGLIQRGDNEEEKRHQLYLLASACVEASISITPEARSAVSRRIQHLTPPTSISAAKALATAGDLAVPHLSKSKRRRMNARTAAACVRALGLIGSETSLGAIEGYALDRRKTVYKELLKAWSNFDREVYARRVLSRRNITELNQLTSLDGVEYLQGIQSLSIEGRGIRDLGILCKLEQLRDLSITSCSNLEDISPIADLYNLTSFSLENCRRIDSIDSITTLRELKALTLWHQAHLGDYETISRIETLTWLQIGSISNLNSLTFLNTLKHLEWLRLVNLDVNNLEPLSANDQLIELRIRYLERVTSLEPIHKLTKLNTLGLGGMPGIVSLEPISELKSLFELRLWNIEQKGLDSLKGLKSLKLVDIRNCTQLADISALTELENLEIVILENCPNITTLEPLSSLSKLKAIYVTGSDLFKDAFHLRDYISGLTIWRSLPSYYRWF